MVDFGQNIKYGFQCKVDSHSVSRICIAPMDFEISPENWKGRADIVTDGAPRRIPLWFTQRSSRWPCEAPRPNCPLCWTRNSRRKLPHWRITMIATTKHPTVHTISVAIGIFWTWVSRKVRKTLTKSTIPLVSFQSSKFVSSKVRKKMDRDRYGPHQWI